MYRQVNAIKISIKNVTKNKQNIFKYNFNIKKLIYITKTI